jgi:hypothetical protein
MYRLRDYVVYVPDYVRGLDVIKLARGGKGAKTVTDAQTRRVGSSTVPGFALRFRLTPDRRWGFTCLVVSPAHHG